jgi:ribulose-5-phosphate 4-epimerase/fuculose-1-phosphate aldolase
MGRWSEEKRTVLEAARQMLARGLVVGTSGNISLRLPGQRPLLAITPSGRHYDLLDEDDIQIVDFHGKSVEGDLTPSMETRLHIGIYRARKNVNAIIHTHSVYASAAAVAGQAIPPILDDQVAFLGGEIKLAGHAQSGSPAQVTAVINALGDRSGLLLANHGAVGTGRTMRDAFTACELIEKTARIFLLALSAGKVNRLPADAVRAAKAIYDKLQQAGS